MLAISVRFFLMVFLLPIRAPRAPFSRFGQIFIRKKYLEKCGDYFCFEYVAWIHKQLNLRLGNIKGLQFTTRIIQIRSYDALSNVLCVYLCVYGCVWLCVGVCVFELSSKTIGVYIGF